MVHRPDARAAPGGGGIVSGRGDPAARADANVRAEAIARADAIVLAGGRGSRLGGADKPALVVGGRSLVGSVVAAAAQAGAGLVVVVGPHRPGLGLRASGRPGGARAAPAGPGPRLRTVREDPPGSGPVPALRRGLAEVSAPWVFVLAADLPFIRAGHLGSLLAAASGSRWAAASGGGPLAPAAGAVLADDTGRPQWLAGCWQTGALRTAAGRYQGGSLRGLLGPLAPALLGPAPDQAGPPPWLDCDTEDDVRLARAWSGAPARGGPDVPR